MNIPLTNETLNMMLWKKPRAGAIVRGGSANPGLTGHIYFYPVREGTLVISEVKGLPVKSGSCGGGFFGFHIHEGERCTGDASDEFKNAGSHLNPGGCDHPYHMGDMPVLLGTRDGSSWSAFYTDRFTPEEVEGHTVIIHDMPDDFRSQPSGGSGTKIACGVIQKLNAAFFPKDETQFSDQ